MTTGRGTPRLLILAVALLLAHDAPGEGGGQEPDGIAQFRRPTEALSIEFDGDRGPTLGDVVAEYARLTGRTFDFDVGLEELASSTDAGFLRPMVVPPASVQVVFEAVLGAHSLELAYLEDENEFVVRRIGERDGGPWLLVDWEPLEQVALHRALLVERAVPAPTGDLASIQRMVGRGAGSLRIDEGDEDGTWLVRGTGFQVVQQIRLLDALEPLPR